MRIRSREAWITLRLVGRRQCQLGVAVPSAEGKGGVTDKRFPIRDEDIEAEARDGARHDRARRTVSQPTKAAREHLMEQDMDRHWHLMVPDARKRLEPRDAGCAFADQEPSRVVPDRPRAAYPELLQPHDRARSVARTDNLPWPYRMHASGALRTSPFHVLKRGKTPRPRVHRLPAAGAFLFCDRCCAELRGRSFTECGERG